MRQSNEEKRALSSTTPPSPGQVPARLRTAAGTGEKGLGCCGESTGHQVIGADVGSTSEGWDAVGSGSGVTECCQAGSLSLEASGPSVSAAQPLIICHIHTHAHTHAGMDLSLPLRSSTGTEAECTRDSPEVGETRITTPQPRAPCCPFEVVLLKDTTAQPQKVQKQTSCKLLSKALGVPCRCLSSSGHRHLPAITPRPYFSPS